MYAAECIRVGVTLKQAVSVAVKAPVWDVNTTDANLGVLLAKQRSGPGILLKRNRRIYRNKVFCPFVDIPLVCPATILEQKQEPIERFIKRNFINSTTSNCMTPTGEPKGNGVSASRLMADSKNTDQKLSTLIYKRNVINSSCARHASTIVEAEKNLEETKEVPDSNDAVLFCDAVPTPFSSLQPTSMENGIVHNSMDNGIVHNTLLDMDIMSPFNSDTRLLSVNRNDIDPLPSRVSCITFSSFAERQDAESCSLVSDAESVSLVSESESSSFVSDAEIISLVSDAEIVSLVSDAEIVSLISESESSSLFSDSENCSLVSDSDSCSLFSDAECGSLVSDAECGSLVSDAECGSLVSDAECGSLVSDADASLTDNNRIH